VDSFQSGAAKVFVGTVKAGGVGLTLTAADTVILVDRPWTPGDAIQAEDRTHRIGQASNVTAVWVQANGVDERVDKLLLSKQQRIDMVLEGKRKTMRGVDSSATEIAMEVMNGLLEEAF
jgi:SNF2 family DNA or RNA helicase